MNATEEGIVSRNEWDSYVRYLRASGRKPLPANLTTYYRDGVKITKEQAEEGYKKEKERRQVEPY